MPADPDDRAKDLNEQVDEATIDGADLVEQDLSDMGKVEPVKEDMIPDEEERDMINEYKADLHTRVDDKELGESMYNGDDDSTAKT